MNSQYKRPATPLQRTAVRHLLPAAVVASAVFVAGWFGSGLQAATVRNAEDLLVVDCLLPGQVRKLGRQSSFLSARRPIRTIQSDCEIRGGEYVSYDRADYRTALKVWLAQAELGDAEAQNYVGEIYAKGLGTEPDYAKAREWYQKALAQGNRRAMVNLGYLYETGLGVEKDLARALNLYRQGSGVRDELLFASTVTAQTERSQAQIQQLQQDLATQQEKNRGLAQQVARLEGELAQRRQDLHGAEQALERARQAVIDKQVMLDSGQGAETLQRLRRQLQDQEAQLARERAQLEQDRAASQEQAERDRLRLVELRAREAALVQQLPRGQHPQAQLTQDLERVRAAASELALALDEALGKVNRMQGQLEANERKLMEQQERFETERKKMQGAIQVSQQDRDLLLLLEGQLSEKQREVTAQRQRIITLERQVGGAGSAGGVQNVAAVGAAGPLLEIISPPLTATRGRAAAMVSVGAAQAEVLGKVVARAGLNQVRVNGEVVAVAPNGLFRANVPVRGEGTEVRVHAEDRSGTRAELDFILLPAQGAIRDVAESGSEPVTAPRGLKLGRYYAVVIGNNAYRHYDPLAGAGIDARKVAEVLKRRYGFETRLVLDGTRLDILAALNEARASLRAEDNLVVYFAGHGELDAKTQQGYWIPVDGQPAQPATWVSNRAISDILNTVAARHVMVIADSCYSGAMTRASLPAFNPALTQQQRQQWIRNMNASRSRTALTSGGLAPVPDAEAEGGSLFAKALVVALEDNNQLLEGQRLFRSVATQIALNAAQATLLQTPEYAPIQFAGHEAGEFFFSPKGS